jgi:hypothetical protein
MTQLYTCTARTEWRDGFITRLKKQLADTSTAADARLVIVTGIETWLLTGNPNDQPKRSQQHDPIESIGWFGVLKGYNGIVQEALYRHQKLDAK